MKRSSRYALKFATQKKKELLKETFDVFGEHLQKTIDLIWEKKIPLKRYMSSKQIDWMGDLGGQYKQLIYKRADEIVKSVKFKKKGKRTKPIIKNLTINFDERIVQIEESHNSFDKWIILRLPFIKKRYKNQRIEILIPIKEHKHSLKFKDWPRAKSIRLSRTYATFVFEKELPKVKEKGEIIGIDSGYKNLLTTSKGQFIGKGFDKTYEKIARKKQGSKAFKRALVERNNKMNECINKELDLVNVKEIRAENLKGLRKGIKGKFRKQFNNKYQRWVYRQALEKLERTCEENRVLFTKVPPAYTSQTCPVCHFRHKDNRRNERFQCLECSYEEHADIVGAINIASRSLNVPIQECPPDKPLSTEVR